MITKINHTHLAHVVSKDDRREDLLHVYFDATNECIVASDGHVLAIYPVDVQDGDRSAVLPVDAFNYHGIVGIKNALSIRPLSATRDEPDEWTDRHWITRGTDKPSSSIRLTKERDDNTWTDYESVASIRHKEPESVDMIAFNPALVARLRKSVWFNVTQFRCEFHGQTSAIVVKPRTHTGESYGVVFLLMPIMMNI